MTRESGTDLRRKPAAQSLATEDVSAVCLAVAITLADYQLSLNPDRRSFGAIATTPCAIPRLPLATARQRAPTENTIGEANAFEPTVSRQVERYRINDRSSTSISGFRPLTMSQIILAEPQLIVQPSVPWPVFKNRPSILVGPIIGVPSGVIGRKPDQNDALRMLPPGNKSATECSRVRRRASTSVQA